MNNISITNLISNNNSNQYNYNKQQLLYKLKSNFSKVEILEFIKLKDKIARKVELDELEQMQFLNFTMRFYKM